MNHTRRFNFVTLIGALGLLMAACQPQVVEREVPVTVPVEVTRNVEVEVPVTQEIEVTAAPSATVPPIPLDRLTISYGTPHVNLDPSQFEGLEDKAIQIQLFDGLVARNAQGEIVPGLAEGWEQTDDLTWRFHLRSGVTFHNGEAFDAAAVKFAIERYKSDISVQASRFKNILEAEIVDDHTVDIHLEAPDPILPNLFINNLYPLPPKYIAEQGDDNMAANPIGTGAYVFKEFNAGTGETILEANPDYWQGAPSIQTVVFKPIPEPATRVAALMSGETDIIWSLPPAMASIVDTSQIASVAKAPGGPRVEYLALVPNGAVPAPEFQNKLVRQAMNYAVDRQGIIDSLLFGFATPLGQAIPAVYLGHNSSLEPYPYDPAKARELLTEAGYPNGFTVDLAFYTRGLTSEQAQVVQSNLADVGITVNLVQMEEAPYIDAILAGKSAAIFSLAEVGRVGIDASEILQTSFLCDGSYNFVDYCNPEVDTLIKEGSQSADLAVRKASFEQANALIREDAPWIFLWSPQPVWGVSAQIEWSPRQDDVVNVFADVRAK